MRLSGGILCALCLGAHGRHLLDLDQVRVLRQSLRLLRSRQLDVQDAILELCVDILFLYGIAHIEAACAGVHAIAFSEGASECHEVTDAYLEQMLKELMEQPLAHNQIWNVNFPQCELEKLRGILYDRKIADCGFFIDEYLEEGLENGRIRLTVHGNYNENAPEGTDFRALVDGYISVGKVNNLR